MEKLKSRKLWVGLSALATGIGMYVSGDKANGVHVIIAAVLGYLGSQGSVDAVSAVTSILAAKKGNQK